MNRRQAMKSVASLLVTSVIPGFSVGCVEESIEYDPRLSIELNRLVKQTHNTISQLAFNEHVQQTGGVAGIKQIDKCYYISQSTFYAEKSELGCGQPTITPYVECLPDHRQNHSLLRTPEYPVFGLGNTVSRMAERDYIQRSYHEDFLLQINSDLETLIFYTFYGTGFKVDLANKDCVMFRTQVNRQEPFDMQIQTQTAGFSFDTNSAISLNDISFYNNCLLNLYQN